MCQMNVGKNITRMDALEKAAGRTKYTDDLCDKSALIIKIKHSTIAHGRVISMDTKEAEKIPESIKVVTCFDVPKNYFLDSRTSVVYRRIPSGCMRPITAF